MTHSLVDEFRDRVNAFLLRTGMSATAFGKQCMNDGSFVDDLNGRDREFRISTIEKVEAWMAAYEADNAANDGGPDRDEDDTPGQSGEAAA